jgi:hypothetical protein
MFNLALAVGLYVVRWRRKCLGFPAPEYRAWDIAVVFSILVSLFLLVMPWYPPDGGPFAGDVSFWYVTIRDLSFLFQCKTNPDELTRLY